MAQHHPGAYECDTTGVIGVSFSQRGTNDVLIRFSYNQGSEVRLAMTNDNHFQSYSECNTLIMAVL